MRSPRIVLPILLISLGVPRLPAATSPPSSATLTIVFSGALDFIYDSKTHLTTVVLPPPVEGYGNTKLPRHQWFIRHEGLAYLVQKPGPISIRVSGNPLAPGEVKAVRFNDRVHKMTGTPSEDVVKRGVSFPLPAGSLVPGSDRGLKFRFAAMGAEKVPPGSDESLVSEATLTVPIQTSDDFISMLVGDTEIRLAIKDKKATVKIGNLPVDDIFYTGGYQSRCEDAHFLIHYTLQGGSDNVDASPIPFLIDKGCGATASLASNSKSQTKTAPAPQAGSMTDMNDGHAPVYGNREDCFMARWVI